MRKIGRIYDSADSVCRKSLAEFAPAGANKVLTIFSGDMCVGENTLFVRTMYVEQDVDDDPWAGKYFCRHDEY